MKNTPTQKNNPKKVGMRLLFFAVLLSAVSFIWAQDNTDTDKKANQAVEQLEATQNPSSNGAAEIDQNESLWETVKQGGFLMIPLIILGLLALTIAVERLIYYYRNKSFDPTTMRGFLEEAKSGSDTKYREELEDELREASRIYLNRLEKGLPLLNGIGNIAPLLGFFGTVMGMIRAFASIANATTVNAKVVAVGIQEALVTTAGGLAVAVPTLAAFYIFLHIVQQASSQSDEIIGDLTKDRPTLSDGNA